MPTPPHPGAPANFSRRTFLKGLGVLATSLLPACRRAEEFAVPYRESPEWTVPGEASAYATCLPRAGGSIPLLAICHEEGPVLLQPNPRYTASSGLDARAQASLWNLYDPERCRQVRFHGRIPETGEFEGAFAAWAQQARNGSRTGFLFGQNPSPVRDMLTGELRRNNPQARFYADDPFAGDCRQRALETLIGPGARQRIELENARFILSLGCDFLGEEPVGPCRAFAAMLTPEGEGYTRAPGTRQQPPHLVVVEEATTLTGGLAHQHIPCPHGMESFLAELACALAPLAGDEGRLLRDQISPTCAEAPPSPEIAALASALWQQRGEALILLGAGYPEQLHTAVLALNTMLEAVGGPLHFVQGSPSDYLPLADLTADLRENRLDTLFLLTPSDPAAENASFAEALRATSAETVRLCLYEDDTARASAWALPATHFLEEWGLDRDAEGRLCLRQPVVLPLWGGIAELELLSSLLSPGGRLLTADNSPRHLSPAYHRVLTCFNRLASTTTSGASPSQRERLWEEALENGFAGESWPRLHRRPRGKFPPLTSSRLPEGSCPLHAVPDQLVQNLADARNQWLAETWHPLTNLAATPAARAYLPGLPHGELRLLRLRGEGLPDLTLPVIGDESEALPARGPHITLPLVAAGNVNTFPWRHVASVPMSALSLEPLPDEKRIPRRPVALYPAEGIPGIPIRRGQTPGPGIPPSPRSENTTRPTEQWGMAIDLNICTGCNACLLACRAENNIPTVGRAELARGRDMQWLRIDRYLVRRNSAATHGHYRVNLPVACQQCEAAPCEAVCPVNAAVHTPDGLSAMAYPRCWGTRYCAANCPYEARRFNFFDYAEASERSARKPANPNVTVRSRGVMEKCSYCVQRINSARSKHRSALMHADNVPSTQLELEGDDLLLPPGSVQTACQMACPMQAITFGNLARPGGNEPETVYRAQSSPRAFQLLSDLGTRPRTSYLMRCAPPDNEPGSSAKKTRL